MQELWLTQLDSKQYQAVTSNVAYLFVVAGAGTGKTRTLITRIAYLIKHLNIKEQAILALTFTNKAALEMKTRLQTMVSSSFKVNITTFHGFGNQVLKQFIPLLNYGYDSDFVIIDYNESNQIIKQSIKALKLDLQIYTVVDLKKRFSKHKKTITSQEISFDHNIKKIYYQYQTYLKANNLLDFDDLIVYTYELLQTKPEVKTYYHQKFQHLLVDEFQDTDFLQYQILKSLITPRQNCFVVGDPDQNIYSFRGTDSRNQHFFLQDFQAQVIVLDHNYRSTKAILKTANLLIKNNNQQQIFQKELKSSLQSGFKVDYQSFTDHQQEAQHVVLEIKKLVKQSYNYQDIMILYRYHGLEKSFEDALIKYNIPYVLFGSLSFYHRSEIKLLLAYVRILTNPHQNFYFQQIINTPKRKIGKKTIAQIMQISDSQKISWFDAVKWLSQQPKANKNLVKFDHLLNEMLEKINTIEPTEEFDIINYLEHKINYLEKLKKIKNPLTIKNYLQELATTFQTKNPDQSWLIYLTQILEQITLVVAKNKKNPNQVQLATIHKVKGLEFKVVFITCFDDQTLPLFGSQNLSQEALEEERRLAYVAITRAKEKLFLTNAQQRTIFGQTNFNLLPSRFLKEMGLNTNLIVKPVFKTFSNFHKPVSKNLNNFAKKTKYPLGKIINHSIFGSGRIINHQKNFVTIAFKAPFGIKKIAWEYLLKPFAK